METTAKRSSSSWWLFGLVGAMMVAGCAKGSFGESDTGSGPEDAGGALHDTGGANDDGGGDATTEDTGGDDGGGTSDVSDCEPVDGGEETCNGRDDDCDGEIDEGVVRECGEQQGVCQGATVACSSGSFPICGEAQYGSDYESDETRCDGLDNDCDGEVDEGCDCEPGESQSCYTGPPGTEGNGPCETGTQTCRDDGTWGECTGETLPGTETCDGTDEDCDGVVDNGVTQSCSNQLGVCDGSSVACTQGSFGTCGSDEYGPNYESGDETACDGLDNDCDGETDESLTQECPQQQGVCSGAVAQCTNGSFQDCSNLYGSEYESDETTCDGLDNDCDGQVDESLTQECPKQEGVCSGAEVACSGGSYPSCGSSDYGSDYESGDETSCDGLDNDCDGQVDEGITRLCQKQKGVCQGATRNCDGGSFPSCDGTNYGSDYESDESTCDGLDNDCDGVVDENDFEAIYTGEAHSCGLLSDGTAYCWGRNSDGQLGLGTTSAYEATPQKVDTNRKFEFLALGKKHSCGETKTDGTYCWGDNEYEQVAQWFSDEELVPKQIGTNGTPSSFDVLTAADNHTCGLTSSGDAHCWGHNDEGQLGDGGTTNNTSADPVDTSLQFIDIAAGATDFTCGLSESNQLYCWGEYTNSQLADQWDSPSDGRWTTPNKASTYRDFDTVVAGQYFGCVLKKSDGEAFCWGEGEDGRLGDGSTSDREDPQAVSGGRSYETLRAGGAEDSSPSLSGGFACGVDPGGKVYCWGENIDGQQGDGDSSGGDNLTPEQIDAFKAFETVAAGGAHGCASDSAGDTYCWGRNEDAQLGTGSTSGQNSTPQKVPCF